MSGVKINYNNYTEKARNVLADGLVYICRSYQGIRVWLRLLHNQLNVPRWATVFSDFSPQQDATGDQILHPLSIKTQQMYSNVHHQVWGNPFNISVAFGTYFDRSVSPLRAIRQFWWLVKSGHVSALRLRSHKWLKRFLLERSATTPALPDSLPRCQLSRLQPSLAGCKSLSNCYRPQNSYRDLL